MAFNQKILYGGIDAGSTTTKVVLLKEDSSFLSAILPTALNVDQTAEKTLAKALEAASAEACNIKAMVGTGYGRVSLSIADTAVTELTCHAAGANFINPDVRMVIDIGGQDCKAIHLDPKGQMADFVMNDKCAAGTGKFLEVVAKTLELDLKELSELHRKATSPCSISSMCVVFVESEIISLLARGKSPADIVAGVNCAFATRIGNMAKRLGIKAQCVLTGGVAKNRGLKQAISQYLDNPLTPLPIDPQLNGALGAAVLAKRLSK